MPKARKTIEQDTGLMVDLIAETVVDQVVAFLGNNGHEPEADRLHKHKDSLTKYLREHAETCYTHNEDFAKAIRSKKNQGNYGRDTLYVFMRHWLAAEMKGKHRSAFDKMPQRFAMGEL